MESLTSMVTTRRGLATLFDNPHLQVRPDAIINLSCATQLVMPVVYTAGTTERSWLVSCSDTCGGIA